MADERTAIAFTNERACARLRPGVAVAGPIIEHARDNRVKEGRVVFVINHNGFSNQMHKSTTEGSSLAGRWTFAPASQRTDAYSRLESRISNESES